MDMQQQMDTQQQTAVRHRVDDESAEQAVDTKVSERSVLSVQETVRMIYALGGGVVLLLSLAIWLLMRIA